MIKPDITGHNDKREHGEYSENLNIENMNFALTIETMRPSSGQIILHKTIT